MVELIRWHSAAQFIFRETTGRLIRGAIRDGHDDDFNLAKQIVDQELKSAKPMQPSWTCMKCKEINEPQFKMCWNCGASYNVSSINNVNK